MFPSKKYLSPGCLFALCPGLSRATQGMGEEQVGSGKGAGPEVEHLIQARNEYEQMNWLTNLAYIE